MIDALYIGPLGRGELVDDFVEVVDVVDDDDTRVVDEVVDFTDAAELVAVVVVLVEINSRH